MSSRYKIIKTMQDSPLNTLRYILINELSKQTTKSISYDFTVDNKKGEFRNIMYGVFQSKCKNTIKKVKRVLSIESKKSKLDIYFLKHNDYEVEFKIEKKIEGV
jgi:deoxycytidine triphosphate deaminase